jgi:prophage DNA circulation protein
VRGYCIAYPVETGVVLYQRDYRQPRNALIAALEQEGPGELQMPTLPPMKVRCHKYSIKEEEKYGGFCTFDMSFVEFGVPPNVRVESSRDNLLKSSQNLNQSVLAMLKSGGVRV